MHTTIVWECDTWRKAIHHIIANLGLSQIDQVKEVTWKLQHLLPQWSPTHPHPSTIGDSKWQNRPASLFFSTNWNIATMIFTAERHEGWSCFGFCFRPLEPHKMTHITVPRAESLQKGGLPENSKLYWVWDLSYIPWCFGIVWFHHLSPTLPNFYQTRQEAGTLYSVCTVALSKTSLFSFFANVSGKGINMLCAKWITAN